MSKRKGPYIPWYPSDIKADLALNMVSLAAYGLWHKLLYIMHDGEPYGHLSVKGQVIPRVNLARMCGCAPDELDGLMAELDSAGVFSRTEDGLVYSRRMVRDAKRADTAANNGRKGGNPRLRHSLVQDNQQVNPRDNHTHTNSDKLSLGYGYGNGNTDESIDELGERAGKGSGETHRPGASGSKLDAEWALWTQHLADKNRVYADPAAEQAARKLLAGMDDDYCVELLKTARNSGWVNFYFPDTAARYLDWKKRSASTATARPATANLKKTVQDRSGEHRVSLRDHVAKTETP
jgi:hypothetical protein